MHSGANFSVPLAFESSTIDGGFFLFTPDGITFSMDTIYLKLKFCCRKYHFYEAFYRFLHYF